MDELNTAAFGADDQQAALAFSIMDDVFTRLENEDTFYQTSDLAMFLSADNAHFHANKLPKKGVATVTRAMYEAAKANQTLPEVEPIPFDAGLISDDDKATLAADDKTAQAAVVKTITKGAALQNTKQ